MSRAPLRRTTCAVLLALALAPAAAASEATGGPATRCDITQLETLSLRFGPAPATLPTGKPVAVTVDVVRGAGTPAELPASGIEVHAGLTGATWGAYDQEVTDASGRATLSVVVPKGSRGVSELDVEAFLVLVDAPCLTVEEHGRVVRPWSRVR